MTASLAGWWGMPGRRRSGLVVAGSAWLVEQAGKRGDGFEQQRVDAGSLVGGVLGVELVDGAAVLGLGGELADPGGPATLKNPALAARRDAAASRG